MRWYEQVIAAHLEAAEGSESVSHGGRMKSERYFVWMEDGRNNLTAENRHAESAVTGATDLFTKQEFDPWADRLGPAFSRYGISWSLRDVQYEPETGFWHYTWDWEVLDGND